MSAAGLMYDSTGTFRATMSFMTENIRPARKLIAMLVPISTPTFIDSDLWNMVPMSVPRDTPAKQPASVVSIT
ncbi:MAG: hypothetical protein BWY85_01222 [Firmicutes bacterium ADurb.Bin506]|nr:MAG: hypothetical protein BWY85_01222 [Firmicutes bacterium ADurb.Bin506]